MNIHFNLCSPSEKQSSVRLVVTHRGKTYRRSVGLSVTTRFWKKEKSGNPSTDAELARIRSVIDTHTSVLSSDREVRQAIELALNPLGVCKDKDKPTFMEHFAEWMARPQSSPRQRKLTYDNLIRFFGNSLDWEDIDKAFYVKICQKMDDAGFGVNYKGKTIENIKRVMQEGYDLGYHRSEDFRQFKRFREDTQSIFLTPAEMDAIWDADLVLGQEMKARDLAWLAYLTCARFSDYSRLTEDNIIDGRIRFSQIKTSTPVILPCSPRVREIFARNGGRAPKICQQVFNRAIKSVCRKAGITEEIEIVESKGARHIHRMVPKCELVTSHTFRRSAATNLYMSGVPAKQVMQMTGHSSITVFEKYVKVDKEKTADILAQNPFFK